MMVAPRSLQPGTAAAPPEEAEAGLTTLAQHFELSLSQRARQRQADMDAGAGTPEVEAEEAVPRPAFDDQAMASTTKDKDEQGPAPPLEGTAVVPPFHRPLSGKARAAGDAPRGVEQREQIEPQATAMPGQVAPLRPAPAPAATPPTSPGQATLSTLQALAHASPGLPRQWLLELNPQPLQTGLLLQAERLPATTAGTPAWTLHLQLPTDHGAGASSRDRLAARLQRGGLRLNGLTLHEAIEDERDE